MAEQKVKIVTLISEGEDHSFAMQRARANACEAFHLHCVSETKLPIPGPLNVDGTPGPLTKDIQLVTEWTIG